VIKKIFFVVIVALIIVTGLMAAHRAQKGSNDFDTFYYAGQAAFHGEGIYYIDDYFHENPKIGPFLYPPFAACFFAIFAWLPISAAAFLWNFLNYILFFLSGLFAFKIVGVENNEVRDLCAKSSYVERILMILVGCSLFFDNITMAQANILIFFIILSAIYAARLGRSFLAGILIAMGTLIKVSPLIFLFYYLTKRNWRVFTGFLTGVILFTLIIPTLIFGVQKNRIYHQQFLGRTIKPVVLEVLEKLHLANPERLQYAPGEEIHFRTFSERVRHNRLTSHLVEKNQALEAAMTRILLKGRQKIGYAAEPIYVARDYEKIPVLFGGIPEGPLMMGNRIVQCVIALSMLGLWIVPIRQHGKVAEALEISTALLAMTLLSPLARSQQFISWIFPYFLIFIFLQHESISKIPALNSFKKTLKWGAGVSLVLYLLQGLPYGKALGMGAWANLLLWLVCLSALYFMKNADKSREEAMV